MLPDLALNKLVNGFEFKSVLDIGYGDGIYTKEFIKKNKEIIAIDYNPKSKILISIV